MYASYHALPEICYEKSDNSSAISVHLMWYQSSHEVHPTNLTFPDLHDSCTEQCRNDLFSLSRAVEKSSGISFTVLECEIGMGSSCFRAHQLSG